MCLPLVALYTAWAIWRRWPDTHKFESRYLDGLVGKYPEDEKIYVERAPIHSVDKLNCPILLLQGDEDKIVPPNQAETMHARLPSTGEEGAHGVENIRGRAARLSAQKRRTSRTRRIRLSRSFRGRAASTV